DPHPRVRYQLLLTLGDVDTPAAADVRQQLLFDGVEDEWMQLAALSAPGWDPGRLWHAAIDRLASNETPARAALIGRIAAAAGTAKQRQGLRDIIAAAAAGAGPSGTWWRAATLEGLASGLRSGSKPGAEIDGERTLVADLVFSREPPPVRRAALQLLEAIGLPSAAATGPVVQNAERLVADGSADAESRSDAVRILATHDVKAHAPLFRGVLERAEPASVQVAAVRALASQNGPDVAATLIGLWDRWTPAVRNEAVRALVREPGRVRLLLDAVAAGTINATETDRSLRIRMMMLDDEALRVRARALFPESAAA